MIPKGIIKLVTTLGDNPRVLIVVAKFLVIKCPSTFNGVIGRALLKALKGVTSIHFLAMKLSTSAGIRQVRGKQWDSRECYNRLLEQAKKEEKPPQMVEVEK